MTEINYAERVQKGIALLDEKFPDWASKIDVDLLNVRDGRRCVTAQLAQSRDPDFCFRDGMDMLGLEEFSLNTGPYTDHGFNAEEYGVSWLPVGYSQDDAYDQLNAIWKREISARQGQADG